MRWEGPNLVMRTLVWSDEPFMRTLFSDWSHGFDGGARAKGWDDDRAHKAMQKWINDMAAQPPVRPCQSDTVYREAVVIEQDNTPIGLDVYTVRGENAKHNRTGLKECNTDFLVLIPGERGKHLISQEFSTIGCKFCFEVLGVEAMTFNEMADTVEMRGIMTTRGFDQEPTQKRWEGKDGNMRFRAKFMKADWQLRVDANPLEKNVSFQFSED